jgi:hypothetical protein
MLFSSFVRAHARYPTAYGILQAKKQNIRSKTLFLKEMPDCIWRGNDLSIFQVTHLSTNFISVSPQSL